MEKNSSRHRSEFPNTFGDHYEKHSEMSLGRRAPADVVEIHIGRRETLELVCHLCVVSLALRSVRTHQLSAKVNESYKLVGLERGTLFDS